MSLVTREQWGPNGWHWLEVRNRTGAPLTIQWGSGAYPLVVPPGRWRYTW